MFNSAPTMKMPSVKEALAKVAEAKAMYRKVAEAQKPIWAKIVARYRSVLADAVAFKKGITRNNNKRYLIA